MQRKGVVNSSWTISITRRPGNQDVWATWWVVSFSSVGAMSLSLGAGVGVRVMWLLGMNPSLPVPPDCEVIGLFLWEGTFVAGTLSLACTSSVFCAPGRCTTTHERCVHLLHVHGALALTPSVTRPKAHVLVTEWSLESGCYGLNCIPPLIYMLKS